MIKGTKLVITSIIFWCFTKLGFFSRKTTDSISHLLALPPLNFIFNLKNNSKNIHMQSKYLIYCFFKKIIFFLFIWIIFYQSHQPFLWRTKHILYCFVGKKKIEKVSFSNMATLPLRTRENRESVCCYFIITFVLQFFVCHCWYSSFQLVLRALYILIMSLMFQPVIWHWKKHDDTIYIFILQ